MRNVSHKKGKETGSLSTLFKENIFNKKKKKRWKFESEGSFILTDITTALGGQKSCLLPGRLLGILGWALFLIYHEVITACCHH